MVVILDDLISSNTLLDHNFASQLKCLSNLFALVFCQIDVMEWHFWDRSYIRVALCEMVLHMSVSARDNYSVQNTFSSNYVNRLNTIKCPWTKI